MAEAPGEGSAVVGPLVRPRRLRTTAALRRSGDDLWIVRVTSSPEKWQQAEALLDQVLPTFDPAG